MTEYEKTKIPELRASGMGYKAIANVLGLSRDAVRGFCRKYGLNGNAEVTGSRYNLNIYLNYLPRIKHLLIWFGNILWVRWFNIHLPHFAENTIKTGYRARITFLTKFNPKDN